VLFDLLKGRQLRLDADDELRSQALNTVAVESSRGFRIAKERASKKVDAIVALAIACVGATSETKAELPRESQLAALQSMCVGKHPCRWDPGGFGLGPHAPGGMPVILPSEQDELIIDHCDGSTEIGQRHGRASARQVNEEEDGMTVTTNLAIGPPTRTAPADVVALDALGLDDMALSHAIDVARAVVNAPTILAELETEKQRGRRSKRLMPVSVRRCPARSLTYGTTIAANFSARSTSWTARRRASRSRSSRAGIESAGNGTPSARGVPARWASGGRIGGRERAARAACAARLARVLEPVWRASARAETRRDAVAR